LCADDFEESLALCSVHNERVLAPSFYSLATPENNGACRNAEFRCSGKYGVILTVIAGGLNAPQLK